MSSLFRLVPVGYLPDDYAWPQRPLGRIVVPVHRSVLLEEGEEHLPLPPQALQEPGAGLLLQGGVRRNEPIHPRLEPRLRPQPLAVVLLVGRPDRILEYPLELLPEGDEILAWALVLDSILELPQVVDETALPPHADMVPRAP